MLTAKVRDISVVFRGARRITTESSVNGRKLRIRPEFPDKNGNALGASYPGSKNYKPGKQGYAPGFPPPKNWSAEPRENLIPMRSTDVPEASLKQTYVPKRPTAAKDAQRLYNQKMREMRYEYQYDNLVKKEERQKEVALKWEKLQVIQREKREQLVKERAEYEINIKEDPLSAENVLNAEGKTLLSNVTESPAASYEPKRVRHSKTVGYSLEPPRVTVLVPKEENELRAAERQRNREQFSQRQHEDHVQMLMTLFHEADGFVHYGNIDQKIGIFLESVAVPHRTLSEMVDSLHRSGGVVTAAEISRRTEELRNELQGTTGRYAGLGYDGLTQWLDDHPDDKDGIKQVQVAETIDSVMPQSQE
ncbi:hypothetical protein COEREDRAFT_81696 [Coemansia reversa NRRL 1564]|uniref:Uncharacterized protein n=1 Tax=Coemansia reversa (strain ATCC 12441 / NRRL 1564) TaxID=763665 RepID=A0A2G5B9Q3_COERN|nr:hypothetical protein COEREDRAFT_81696 [Coemansia reversa NRRL 1564]|eukprot:PIA15745.1 hypothetical protein COEREDRAFT_81696 [Coemansia reversa NRRL 1564]